MGVTQGAGGGGWVDGSGAAPPYLRQRRVSHDAGVLTDDAAFRGPVQLNEKEPGEETRFSLVNKSRWRGAQAKPRRALRHVATPLRPRRSRRSRRSRRVTSRQRARGQVETSDNKRGDETVKTSKHLAYSGFTSRTLRSGTDMREGRRRHACRARACPCSCPLSWESSAPPRE